MRTYGPVEYERRTRKFFCFRPRRYYINKQMVSFWLENIIVEEEFTLLSGWEVKKVNDEPVSKLCSY